MRVLFLSTSGHLGGAERVLIEMVRASAADGRRPGVLIVEDGPLASAVEDAGGETLLLPLPRGFGRAGESQQSPLATLTSLATTAPSLVAYSWRLRATMRRWRPDVIHSNGVKMHVLAARVASCPLVWHMHDYVGPRRVSARLLRHYAGRPAVVVANSSDVARDGAVALGRSDIVALPNAVDLDRFTPNGPGADLDSLARLAPAGSIVRVGLVATYARWKGHETFVRALARLSPDRPVRGYIVGGSVYRSAAAQVSQDELAALARSLGIADRIGFVAFQDNPAPVYRALDVVVHASTAPEPFGLVVAEAMACGRAVVATSLGGVAEVADASVAVAHRAGDAADLARAIERCAADPALRSRLGAAARVRAEQHFAPSRFADGLREIHRRAVDTGPRGAAE